MLEAFKLKFSLDVVVTIHWRSCFELILWMNKLKTMDREAVCWKFLFKIQKVNPLKQLGKHYLDRGSAFTQVKSTEHMAKFNTKSISNWGTFCNFSLAPKRKIYKTSMKHLKIHKFPFKNVIVLAIECKMYLEIQQRVAFQNRPELRREENKVEFLKRRFLDENLLFLHKTKAEHSFQLSLSIFCLLTVYF